jgi:exopolyphosphatase
VSCIGYSYLQANSEPHAFASIVPLIQTNRGDIYLRPENIQAFKQASLDPNWEDLLCLDDISTTPFPSNRFVLVDHNRLLDRFNTPDAKVTSIIDHHGDEGCHLGADPRIIQVPTGSCASLVVNHFKNSNAWNPDLAMLLFSAILVDTNGLKPGGKVTPSDDEAARLLFPLIANSMQSTLGLSAIKSDSDLHGALKLMTNELLVRKGSISHLSNRDLLRRDYKQYLYTSANSSTPGSITTISVGLSTVPVDLKEWVQKDSNALVEWMKERSLMVHGSLTSFRRVNDKREAKHKRQQLWIIRKGVSEEFEKKFWSSVESDKVLKVEVIKDFEEKMVLGPLSGEVRFRVYKQGNVNATRKAVAPLVKQIVEDFLANQ